jgi:hypothetical protein
MVEGRREEKVGRAHRGLAPIARSRTVIDLKDVENFKDCDLGPGEEMQVRVVTRADVHKGRVIVIAKDGDLRDLVVSQLRVGVWHCTQGDTQAMLFGLNVRDGLTVAMKAGEQLTLHVRNDGRVMKGVQAGLIGKSQARPKTSW